MVPTLSLYSLCTISLWLPGIPSSLGLWTQVSEVPLIAAPGWTDPNPASVEWVRRYARTITVTVWVDDRWSSGILVHRQDQTYTVITNQHVVAFGQKYQVVLADGQRYDADLRPSTDKEQNDLAVLEFHSPDVSYPVARFASSLSLVPGAPVFAAGFPIAKTSASQPQFHFTSGQVSLISDRVLQGGYQIGYTNPIQKGMSGGPVLNRWGQVIAINGMHAYPLWGNPYIFVDGSKPNPAEHQVMRQSSWAIPAERFLQFIPTARKVKR
ncbi:S1 family peptidase [Acaryochloris marina NIES-2412]|uniref:S1 family peptidase n=1 Tax=Acaryochloris marina TaxID=155978 RepID=UPI0040585D4D